MRFFSTMMIAAAIAAMSAGAQVNQRRENQQDRVAQGVASGQLTAGETANLEKKVAAIHQEVHADRTLNGGPLTPAERKQVNQQQNRMSNQVFTDKHNAMQRPAPTTAVGARRLDQQQRIAGGIASGKLSAGEAAKVEKGETAINKEVRTDRAANGGKLTAAEHKQVNQQQNQMSRKIYRVKHN